jgi:hypothetical protein
VGSALNALTTAAGLFSMAAAATLGEVLQLRLIYVFAGLIVGAGGLVGLFVLVEPETQAEDTPVPQTAAPAEAPSQVGAE